MKQGYLSQYFKGIAVKTLSAVEADSTRSNQHEFNGVTTLKKLFGLDKRTFSANFIYLNDNDDDPPTDIGFITWYDARKDHPSRTEYRMYFPTTKVSICASAGDELFIGLRADESVLVIIAEAGSTIKNQLRWLFGINIDIHPGFSIREELESEQDRIEFASRVILEQMGIEIQYSEDTYLDEMLHRFNGKFPNTKEFSAYARSTLKDIDSTDNPDDLLISWIEREEILFRTLEKHLIADQLNKGFNGDVDNFVTYSLSIQNRRKSRAGQSLENHVEELFINRNISYSRTMITELKSKPDFIFPGIREYLNMDYPESDLLMLGVKSTCKDRWRQVLTEAVRIKEKHLLTLEAAISENQTNEMKHHNLHLVVPRAIHNTYSENQQRWLMTISDFVYLVSSFQKRTR